MPPFYTFSVATLRPGYKTRIRPNFGRRPEIAAPQDVPRCNLSSKISRVYLEKLLATPSYKGLSAKRRAVVCFGSGGVESQYGRERLQGAPNRPLPPPTI